MSAPLTVGMPARGTDDVAAGRFATETAEDDRLVRPYVPEFAEAVIPPIPDAPEGEDAGPPTLTLPPVPSGGGAPGPGQRRRHRRTARGAAQHVRRARCAMRRRHFAGVPSLFAALLGAIVVGGAAAATIWPVSSSADRAQAPSPGPAAAVPDEPATSPPPATPPTTTTSAPSPHTPPPVTRHHVRTVPPPTPTTTASPAQAPDLLRAGDAGPAVSALQRALFGQGYTYIQVTGVYDAATTRGVLQLQRTNDVSGDPAGVFGPNSRAALATNAGNSTSTPTGSP